MLTFLRKTRRSLVESGGPGKYLIYALGEIALVVIGILIALQINNWSEWRKDRIKEREILQDLQENIELNNKLLSFNLSFLDSLDASADVIINVLNTQQTYSDTLNIHFNNATKHGFLNFMLSKSSFEAYKNVGFDIIQNKSLKDEIIDLFEVTYPTLERVHDFLESESEITRVLVFDKFFRLDYESLYPFNYDQFLKDEKYPSLFNRIRSNRGLLKKNIQVCLDESKMVLQFILERLGEN